jgi:group I intron endonuclease
MIIYKATNKITGKCYIGQTKQKLEKRIQGHSRESKNHKGRPFSLSITKYGIDNFVFEELEKVNSIEELNDREIFWIKELNTISPSGYNITAGGQGARMITTGEFSKNVSQGLKNSEKWNKTKNSEEYQEKIKNKFYGYFKGKKFSDEHKRKIWEKNKDRIIDFNKSTSKKWIVIDSKNNIERILSKEDYFTNLGLDAGCLSRMSNRLYKGKTTKRYKGYYCIIDKGQTDEEIMKMVNEFDNHFNAEYKILNKVTKQIKILKKQEVYSYCIENTYDYSSFLRMLKGKFNSYKDWIIYTND